MVEIHSLGAVDHEFCALDMMTSPTAHAALTFLYIIHYQGISVAKWLAHRTAADWALLAQVRILPRQHLLFNFEIVYCCFPIHRAQKMTINTETTEIN